VEALRNAAGDRVDKLNRRLQELRDEWAAINAQTFAGDTHCPTCQQALPPDQVEAARANWNEAHAKALAANADAGKARKAEVDKWAAEFDRLDLELNTATQAAVAADEALKNAEAAVPAPVVIAPTYTDTPEMLAAAEALQALQDTLATLDTDT